MKKYIKSALEQLVSSVFFRGNYPYQLCLFIGLPGFESPEFGKLPVQYSQFVFHIFH